MPPMSFSSLAQLAVEHQASFLISGIQAGFLGGLHVLELLQRALDRLEVGQHAAANANEGRRTLGFGDDVARLALAPTIRMCRGLRMPAAGRTSCLPRNLGSVFRG